MDAPNRDFTLSRLERVVTGPGKIAALGDELARYGRRRAVVVTGATLGRSALVGKVVAAADSRVVAVFDGARQHVPRGTVAELCALMDHAEADSLVALGGGSPIDTCKAAMHARLDRGDCISIAVPTTLSAGEYTHVGGVTDEATRVKTGVSDPRLQARTVVNDPLATLETPDWLWVGTGVRALDHAIESIYAVAHHPMSDALGAKAIAMLVEHLPASIGAQRDERVARRGACQLAAWFSIVGAMNTGFGLSHLLGHQIGPRWGVPHGFTSCITLPHAMRVVAAMAPARFGPIAEGLGVPFDPFDPAPAAFACADRVAQFIARFDVPRSLGDAGVPRGEMADIAGIVQADLAKRPLLDRTLTIDEVIALLNRAF